MGFYIRIMEKKMEATILCRDYIGIMHFFFVGVVFFGCTLNTDISTLGCIGPLFRAKQSFQGSKVVGNSFGGLMSKVGNYIGHSLNSEYPP